MKTCRGCDRELPLGEFQNNCTRKDGKQTQCKDCMNARKRARRELDAEYRQAWRAANPDKVKSYCRKQDLKKKYGITPEQYDYLLGSQGGVCAICSAPPQGKALAVDHDHRTGRVRGILCQLCNQALGHMRDDVSLLERAIQYLQNHQGE